VVGAPVEVGCCHRDDEARRAEAALAAVVLDHRRLHGVELPPGAGDALHRAYGATVKLRQEKDAGVERAGPGIVRDHDGAGAAIAFVAAFLGAGQALLLAQPVEKRGCRGRIDGLRFPVEKKPDCHPCLIRRVT
jgi:hypothetical protein